MLARLLNDVRYAVRGFALPPAFGVSAVAMAAVAVAANVTRVEPVVALRSE